MPVIQFFLLLPKTVIGILYAKKEPIHICLSLAQVLSALCTQGQFFLILQEDNQVLWQMFTLLCRTVHSLGCYPLFLHIWFFLFPHIRFEFLFYFFKRLFFYSCVWAFCPHVRLCTKLLWCLWRQKRELLDPWELELQMVLKCDMNSENQAWVLCKSSMCTQRLSHPSTPPPCICF